MNTDIRLSVGFWQHPKVFRLEKKLGLKAIRSLQILWCWCAQNRPDGILEGFDPSDIEFVADWRGKKGSFVEVCIACGWIIQDKSSYLINDWDNIRPLPENNFGRKWDISRSEWEKLRYTIFKRDNYICQYCGSPTDKPDCDHVIPVSRGGKSVFENLLTACPSCNRSKGSKLLEEWKHGMV